jgi:hypothetical protein
LIVSSETEIIVAQWALLLGLGVLVVVMYRQLAYLLLLSRAASGHGGLAVGERAPDFTYWPVHSMPSDGQPKEFRPDGVPTLILFVNPGCGSCEVAVRNLEQVTRKVSQLRVLAVTDSDPEAVNAIDAFRETAVELIRVERTVPNELYRTYSTPYAYGIDASGAIRASGEAVTARQIKGFVRETLAST